MGAFAVLHLLDRVIEPHVDNLFIADFRAGHVAVGVDNAAGFTVKQTVIHGCAHSFGIPS